MFIAPPPRFNQTSYAKVFLPRQVVYNNYFCFMFPHWHTHIFLAWTTCPFLIPTCTLQLVAPPVYPTLPSTAWHPTLRSHPPGARGTWFCSQCSDSMPSPNSLSLPPALCSAHPPETLSAFCATSLGTLRLEWKPARAVKP